MLDIRKLLAVMNEHNASDLYMTVDSPPAYRINGIVRPTTSRALEPEETEMLALSVMNEKQQNEFERTNEVNLALYYVGLGRFRVNIFRQRACVGIVVRQIKSQIPTLDELNLPPILKELSLTKRGLIIVAGATGCGKSTTLASMIDYRNSNLTGHIVTIEDPIEFVHVHKKSLLTQREIGMDTESYHNALKNALRQAPDVVLIGEIRDQETMEAAITFAETGHLCLATLHSNNANQAMERIMNFFPAERHRQIYLQLSLNLRAVVSQRLLRQPDGSRIPAVEVLLGTPRVKDLIYKGQIHELKEAMEKSVTQGMQTFDQDLFTLYQAQKITLEEALRNADSANNLRLRVKLANDHSLDDMVSPFSAKDEASDERLETDENDFKLQLQNPD